MYNFRVFNFEASEAFLSAYCQDTSKTLKIMCGIFKTRYEIVDFNPISKNIKVLQPKIPSYGKKGSVLGLLKVYLKH